MRTSLSNCVTSDEFKILDHKGELLCRRNHANGMTFTIHKIIFEHFAITVWSLDHLGCSVQYCYDEEGNIVIIHDYAVHDELGIYMANINYAITGSIATQLLRDLFGGDFNPQHHMENLLNFMNDNFHLYADTIEGAYYGYGGIATHGLQALIDEINMYEVASQMDDVLGDRSIADNIDGNWWTSHQPCDIHPDHECSHVFCSVEYVRVCENYGSVRRCRITKSARNA